MRNSPEEYGAYVGFELPVEELIEAPYFTREQFRKIGRGVMNYHHLFWIGKNHKHWMRDQHDFQPQMYIPAHNALHKECPSVPEISTEILRIVRADFEPKHNTLDSLDELLCLISHAATMEQVHPIDRQLAQLSIHALERQRYYLRDNISEFYSESVADRNYDDYIRGYK